MPHNSSVVLQFPKRIAPRISISNVPQRRKNTDYRSREYLTEDEIHRLSEAATRMGRHGHRDATLIMLSYRHGLRVTELVNLRWEQIDLKMELLLVNRLKHGKPSVHPLHAPELHALQRLQTDYPKMTYVFSSERKAPLTPDAIRKILSRAGNEAGLPFTIHPHMLRHACGYKLAQAGQDTRAIQDYLGHRNIQHTVRYTQLSADRFRNFWCD